MTSSDFVRTYLGLYTNPDYNPDSVNLLAGIVDTSKDGLISFAEFQALKDCSAYQMLCIRQLSSCLILMEMEWLHLMSSLR